MTLLALAALTAAGVILPTPAQAQDPENVVLASVLVPRAVGLGLTGQQAGAAVSFGRAPRPDPYLVGNGFTLEQCRTTLYQPDQLQGGLTFSDDLGRRIHLASRIGYSSQAPGRYTVTSLSTTPFTPAIPALEVYMVPAQRMSLRQMSDMGFTDLLAFARENTVLVAPETLDPSPRTYQVLVFALDRLQPGDDWVLFADDTQGFSWKRDGWAVAGISAVFAVNGPQQTVFRAFYAPGRGNALSGMVLAAGAFTNQHQPPEPLAPSPVDSPAPDMQELRSRYLSKSYPALP